MQPAWNTGMKRCSEIAIEKGMSKEIKGDRSLGFHPAARLSHAWIRKRFEKYEPLPYPGMMWMGLSAVPSLAAFKILSVNYSNLPPTNHGSGEVKEAQETCLSLFVANQQFSKPLEPGVGYFHHPTPWVMIRIM